MGLPDNPIKNFFLCFVEGKVRYFAFAGAWGGIAVFKAPRTCPCWLAWMSLKAIKISGKKFNLLFCATVFKKIFISTGISNFSQSNSNIFCLCWCEIRGLLRDLNPWVSFWRMVWSCWYALWKSSHCSGCVRKGKGKIRQHTRIVPRNGMMK